MPKKRDKAPDRRGPSMETQRLFILTMLDPKRGAKAEACAALEAVIRRVCREELEAAGVKPKTWRDSIRQKEAKHGRD